MESSDEHSPHVLVEVAQGWLELLFQQWGMTPAELHLVDSSQEARPDDLTSTVSFMVGRPGEQAQGADITMRKTALDWQPTTVKINGVEWDYTGGVFGKLIDTATC